MLPNDPPPRLPPVQTEDLSEDQRAFLAKWTGGFFSGADKHPVLLTFAHNPKLAEVFSNFNIHLLTANSLPVKQRQIAIMRLAWITNAVFMWSSHLNTSISCGLDDAMYEPIKAGAPDPYFTDFERIVIRATEELVQNHEVSPESWRGLMQEWSEAQMLDFLFTVGCYMTIAYVMRSAGVQRQPELLELAERYGAPVRL
jgi:4-carboxymuconolactone decarboxylase